LGENFIEKIEANWTKKETEIRTENAIRHLAEFIPSFSSATIGSKPLFGAQQIPGDDPTLRVAEVSFPTAKYARCEIVKVSSVLDMIDAITKDLVASKYLDSTINKTRVRDYFEDIDESKINNLAESLCNLRKYPIALAHRSTIKTTTFQASHP